MKILRNVISIAAILLVSFSSFAQSVDLNKDSGKILWEGKKIGGSHNGAIDIKSGNLTFENSMLKAAHVVIDMNSIVCYDIENEEYNKKLIGHLKNDDFFGVEKNPSAEFKSTKITKVSNDTYKIIGEMTIKKITHPIEFEAKIMVENNSVFASSKFMIDRAKYDIRYGSKSFFDNLGDKVINDEFEISFKINETL